MANIFMFAGKGGAYLSEAPFRWFTLEKARGIVH